MTAPHLSPAAERLLADIQFAGPSARLECLADGRWHLRAPPAAYARVQRPVVDELERAGRVVEAPSRPLIRRTLRRAEAA